jgi:hypothetical protein
VSRTWLIAMLSAASLAAVPALAAADNPRLTEQQSLGPAGGNATVSSQYRGISADGTKLFFQTSEPLVSADTDTTMDIYERSNGTTTLLSIGPGGGNAAKSASFVAASQDGSKMFFRTAESLVAADTDTAVDIYMRANGVTTLMSTGPNGGNGAFNAIFDAITPDGSTLFFDTSESLVSGDTDAQRDVYQRSGSTTTELSIGSTGGNGSLDSTFAGASRDGSHVVFTTDESLVSTDFDTRQDVYDRSGGTTRHLSIGPAGGNGNIDFDYDAFFAGISADGSKIWIKTSETLTFDDTDTADDVYEISGGTISRISFGPIGGNADLGAYFDGASQDGSRVFLDTTEALVPQDTDSSYDVYQWAGGHVTLLSTGPNGGNGAFFAAYRGATPDGSHVYFETNESLVSADTDTNQDVYDASGGQTTLVSTGPTGGNGDIPTSFMGSSTDGSRVFFNTAESLVATDLDDMPDIYERFAGDTTLLSVGAVGGSGQFPVIYDGASQDGTRVFFETDEPLVATDTDPSQDVYSSSVVSAYARPKGATPVRASLVPAFQQCTAPNRSHGSPLAFGSCAPPAQTSGFLTVGSPDANGKTANSVGNAKFLTVLGNPSTPADEADVKIQLSMSDVRKKSDLSDYTGELQLQSTMRITDRLNGSAPIDPATLTDLDFPVAVPCVGTADVNVGSTCSVATTVDSVLPGAIAEIKRTVIELAQVQVFDGGSDGLAATPGNTLFAVQGVFVP